MNKNIKALYQIASKKKKLIIGLMSGTSLDGLDVALCEVSGTGTKTKITILHFKTVNYDFVFKKAIKSIFSKPMVSLEKVTLLNAWVGRQHAVMINNCLDEWKIKNADVDVIASHGQTIYHSPITQHGLVAFDNATLQIGDADHIALHTGITTISDFRQKHVAAGGEGAPLAVYGDYLLFSKKGQNRILLNIGGITNFTFLSADGDANKMFSTDIGPGNTLMDAYMQKQFTHLYYDENASNAIQGTCNNALLNALLTNTFFEKPFPKTTGPELFNLAYLLEAKKNTDTLKLSFVDTMATLNTFSAQVIIQALQTLVHLPNLVLYCSGGGIHNPMLVQQIKEAFPQIVFKTTKDLGINPDAKEAVLFAVLANETLTGNGFNFGNGLPNVNIGKISFAG